MANGILLMQRDGDSRILALTSATDGATSAAVDLTNIQSIKFRIIDSTGAAIDQLELGDGIEIVSAARGTIRVTFSSARLATAGVFAWRLILEWIDGAAPITWPLSLTAPKLIIAPQPAPPIETAARVYFGIGTAGLASVAALSYLDGVTSLDFTTGALNPSNQKVYIAYPASWGYAQLWVYGTRQTEAYVAIIVAVSSVNYYLYESTQLLTATGIEVEVSS